ncbi:unnamed protein product [Acanthosepion pharaonis]|uniref:Uncharacterized protein n=1 Tax=Acanthosepion pharaonis TaxID=158019 RepID=A0A812BB87_ACAPH|nr:unnamed protein product [Sepia pharaonis]
MVYSPTFLTFHFFYLTWFFLCTLQEKRKEKEVVIATIDKHHFSPLCFSSSFFRHISILFYHTSFIYFSIPICVPTRSNILSFSYVRKPYLQFPAPLPFTLNLCYSLQFFSPQICNIFSFSFNCFSVALFAKRFAHHTSSFCFINFPEIVFSFTIFFLFNCFCFALPYELFTPRLFIKLFPSPNSFLPYFSLFFPFRTVLPILTWFTTPSNSSLHEC